MPESDHRWGKRSAQAFDEATAERYEAEQLAEYEMAGGVDLDTALA